VESSFLYIFSWGRNLESGEIYLDMFYKVPTKDYKKIKYGYLLGNKKEMEESNLLEKKHSATIYAMRIRAMHQPSILCVISIDADLDRSSFESIFKGWELNFLNKLKI